MVKAEVDGSGVVGNLVGRNYPRVRAYVRICVRASNSIVVTRVR